MRQPLSTTTTGTPRRCLTRRVRIRLPLATIEEIDHLADLTHLTRQHILRRLLEVALVSDTPLQPTGPAPAEQLHAHAQLTDARSFALSSTRTTA